MTDSRHSDDTITIEIPRSALAALARVLAPLLSDLVQPKAEPETYGSRHPYPPPPGRSHRWMREHGPELIAFGGERSGGRRGRSVVWTISAPNWRRYVEATRRTEPAPIELPKIDPERWIREAGNRLTRRSA